MDHILTLFYDYGFYCGRIITSKKVFQIRIMVCIYVRLWLDIADTISSSYYKPVTGRCVRGQGQKSNGHGSCHMTLGYNLMIRDAINFLSNVFS